MLVFEPKTMTYDKAQLTDQEKLELIRLAKVFIFTAKPEWENEIVQHWFQCVSATEDQRLFLSTVVMPSRFLLSVV